MKKNITHSLTPPENHSNTNTKQVKALCVQFNDQITPICINFIDQMMSQYNANRSAKWKLKDAALTLLLAVSVKSSTKQFGANELNAKVNVMKYFGPHILSELQART